MTTPMKPIHKTLLLMCRLTEHEMADRGEEMAQALEAMDLADEARKSQAAIMKTRKAKAKDLQSIVLNGQELREVPVTVTFDDEANEAIITRDDTGEEHMRRPLTDDEKQPTLFSEDDEEDEAPTEDESAATPFDEEGDQDQIPEDHEDDWDDGVTEETEETEEAESKANLQADGDDDEIEKDAPEDGGWTADTNDKGSEFFHLFNAGSKKSACGSFKADKGAALLPIEFTADMACPECLDAAE